MESSSNYFLKNIKGKRIVITGGTTGIGRATAELLVSLGGRVLILGRDQQAFEEAFNEIKSKYPNGELYGAPADVTKKADIDMIMGIADDCLDGIDILVNNAALGGEGVTADSGFEQYKYILETNVLGYMAFTHEVVAKMSAQGSGHIVNVGSMSADTHEETGTIYVATKSAVRGFSIALRKEVNHMGIKVSLVEPGATKSDMQPGSSEDHSEKVAKMEMLKAEDIAISILFCLSQPQRCDVVKLQVKPRLQNI